MGLTIRKPVLRTKVQNNRILGASAVGAKMSGLQRKVRQSQRLGGYWVRKNGKDVFVLMPKPESVGVEAELAKAKDRMKKKVIGR